MKTLNLYVSKSFFGTLGMALGILTFCMLGARLIEIFGYISRGIPLSAAVMFMVYVFPIAFAFTIPFSILVSVMLVFGRMSADNEITAMRACGISILQIISPIIMATFALTCLCIYLQADIGPQYLGRARSLVFSVAVDQPLAMLEPGRWVEYGNIMIYVEERVGENEIRSIQIFRLAADRSRPEQDITATHGRIEVDQQKQVLTVILNNATIVAYEAETDRQTRIFNERISFPIDYGEELNRQRVGRQDKYLSFREIIGRTVLHRRLGLDTTKLEVELNERIALALSPIAFMLLGLPLAIRTSRRETSVGLFLSVILAGIYFVSVMICHSLDVYPQYRPQVLLWLPNIAYQVFGVFFLIRVVRR